jgi:hypothetical protein
VYLQLAKFRSTFAFPPLTAFETFLVDGALSLQVQACGVRLMLVVLQRELGQAEQNMCTNEAPTLQESQLRLARYEFR